MKLFSFLNNFFHLFLLLSFNLFSQTTLFVEYNNGKWQHILTNPFTLEISNHLRNQNIFEYNSASVQSTSSTKFNLLLQKDSADAFNPGLYCYATNTGWSAMDDGTGKKFIVMSFLDTSKGIASTVYFSPNNFQPVYTNIDTGFVRTSMYTEIVNVQMTGSQFPEHVIHYSSNTSLPRGITQLRVKSGIGGSTQFSCQISGNINTYFIPSGFLNEDKTNFDLNSNGLFEIIGVGSLSNGQRLYIYDNFTILDSIDENRFSFFNNAFTTSNDINSDGKPEVITSVNGLPRFHQWNNSINKFQLLDSLGYTKKLWIEPENIDQDSSKEIITLGGFNQDTIVIYDSHFQLKYKFKHQSIPLIHSFFVSNINNSQSKEIILSSQYFGTAVYDLSTGTQPIWYDKNFETMAVSDFRNTGHTELLGIYRKTVSKNDLMLIDGSNNFQVVWSRVDSTMNDIFSYQRFVGPLNPLKLANLIFGFSSVFIANPPKIDFDQDGKDDFVVEVFNKNFNRLFLIINSDGEIVDSLSEIQPAYVNAIAHDFNNNGAPEIILTGYNLAKNITYIYEYKYPSRVSDNPVMNNKFILEQNFPNPFNSKSKIILFVPGTKIISLKLFNILGEEIETLIDHKEINGYYEYELDSHKLVSGTYFYQAISDNQIVTKKMIIIK